MYHGVADIHPSQLPDSMFTPLLRLNGLQLRTDITTIIHVGQLIGHKHLSIVGAKAMAMPILLSGDAWILDRSPTISASMDDEAGRWVYQVWDLVRVLDIRFVLLRMLT